MMRRLCLIGNPNIIHIRRWVQDFSNRGWEVHLIGEHKLTSPPPSGCVFYDLTQIINFPKLRYIVWVYMVRKLLDKIKPDILHALGVASAGWLAAASKFHPFLCTSLGSDLMLLEKRPLPHQFFTQWSLTKVDKLICVSKPLDEKAFQLGVPDHKREIINLGVDLSVFKPSTDRERLRQKLGLPGQRIVAFIRAIQPNYQPMKCAQVIPEIIRKYPNTLFLFFTYNADQKLLDTIVNFLTNNHVIHQVRFLPKIQTTDLLAKYYQASDITISIPISDGMPVSVMEAMACQTALITTDLPNLRGLINNEINGLLIPVDDDNALLVELLSLLSNPALMDDLRNRSQQSIDELSSRTKVLSRITELYNLYIMNQENLIHD